MNSPRPIPVDDYVDGVLAADRTALGRAITLVESRAPHHREAAQAMLLKLLPHAGNSHRVGITGVPGVGKSTFIEAFGKNLTGQGLKVAVLAVDPSSERTGGSIMGDKTRMQDLSVDPNAFIRPSPTSGTLGGVARATRATLAVCEAAGFDVVIVETVGVGQSETTVADMVDFFLLLMLPGGGDELQGIKKGVLELADMIAVNKSDGGNEQRAKMTATEYLNALKILTPKNSEWRPPVLTCSALKNDGLDRIWEKIGEHRAVLTESGAFEARRKDQRLRWMWSMVRDELLSKLDQNERVAEIRAEIEEQVADGRLTTTLGADKLLAAFAEK